MLGTAIRAAFTEKDRKVNLVRELKVQAETGKRLTQLMWELKIIADSRFLQLDQQWQRISRMSSGWIKYLNKGP